MSSNILVHSDGECQSKVPNSMTDTKGGHKIVNNGFTIVNSKKKSKNLKAIMVAAPRVTGSPNLAKKFSNVYSMKIDIIQDGPQSVHTLIEYQNLICYGSFVYAVCTRQGRLPLWDNLKIFAESIDKPWVIGGDFNIIANLSERIGGGLPNAQAMGDFNNMFLDFNLHDIGFSGNAFTWNRGTMWKRLDRILFNDERLNKIPLTYIEHLSKTLSDHSPLLLNINLSSGNMHGNFHFQNMWLLHHDFLKVVESNWSNPLYPDDNIIGMHRLCMKLKRLKQMLRLWNKVVFKNIFVNIAEVENKLNAIEMDYINDHSNENLLKLNEAKLGLFKLQEKKEVFWKQKAASKFLCEGERNTKFFHSMANHKKVSSHIHKITQPNGVVLNTHDLIYDSGVEYFFKNFNKDFNSQLNIDTSLIPCLIDGRAIFDNILLAQDLVHDIHKPISGGKMVVKIDITKAYDNLNWDSLYTILNRFGFNEIFINLVAGCGGILRKHYGKVIIAFAGPVSGNSAFLAELHGLIYGISICIKLGFNRVWIEDLSTINFKISHIFREGNGCADVLAKLGCTFLDYYEFHEDDIPSVVKGLTRLDRAGLPYIRHHYVVFCWFVLFYASLGFGHYRFSCGGVAGECGGLAYYSCLGYRNFCSRWPGRGSAVSFLLMIIIVSVLWMGVVRRIGHFCLVVKVCSSININGHLHADRKLGTLMTKRFSSSV
ncbi:hypothetical protein KFK09_003792 [Dendrobium nobile]|uniref:Reverse transcriptase domain-containing protein n=1 Tax=Dendrobium nobile TaxID=94219 RepID=A0A8T3C142_DENNO|nr:hypothetical protein KFK09_003792 [Dendrobium nobile]